MRRLFSFRSSNTDPKDKNVDKSNTDTTESHEEDCSSSNDFSLLNLRRSQSFSYAAPTQIEFEECKFPHECNFPLQCQRKKEEQLYSNSSKGYNSSPNSPIALKCKPTRFSNFSKNNNKTLDLYIEEEEDHIKDHTASFHRILPHIHYKDTLKPNFEDIYEHSPLGEDEKATDEILLRKIKEIEDRVRVISNQDYEIEMIKNRKGLSLASLVCIIREINEDSKNLALELVSEIKSRLGDRFLANENFKNVKRELDLRTRRLEREKVEVKLNLERELDRRSNEFGVRVQRFQAEEKRLRERVRELAEQNVALQREVNLYRENERVVGERMESSELEMKELEMTLERVKMERNDLLCVSKEWQEKCKRVEEERDDVAQNFEEKIEETKSLQKAISKLQIIKIEQEKTISELVRGFKDKFENIELVRMASVEQKLRKEVELCRCELETVKNMNKSILKGLNGNFVGLNFEIRDRLESLQNKGLRLLDENTRFCEKLLDFVKFKGVNGKMDNELMNYSLKCKNMKIEVENLKRSFRNVELVLDDKFKSKDQISQIGEKSELKDEMALKLKEEMMLNKILREKIFSKEFEIEELETEIASLIRKKDFQENEIKKLDNELSILSHRAKDMKIQLIEKDENIKSLQDEFQGTITKLNSSRDSLKMVTKDRDVILQEVKELRERNSKMQDEIILLSKKVEEQDEELLIKEGQIDLIKKPFDRWNEI